MNKIFKAQVAGAFYKEGLGEIDLVWGEITDSIKHKGYGLVHILDKHPEFDVYKIPEIIDRGEVVSTHNGFNIIYKNYKIGLNVGWNERGIKYSDNKWIVTSYEAGEKNQGRNSDSFTKGETLPLNSSPYSSINPDANTIIKKLKDYPLDNHMNIKEDEINNLRKDLERQLNINPIKEFGKNYAEYYQDGKGAIKKLIDEYKEFERFNKKLKKGHKKRLDAKHLTLFRS